MTTRSSIKLCAIGLAALLVSAAASGARADLFTFDGTLESPVHGGTSVSGQFGFDFTTDTVTSYKFTAPGDSFDSSVNNSAGATTFTSGGITYLMLTFIGDTPIPGGGGFFGSEIVLNVNPTITEFFTQGLPLDGTPEVFFSGYDCAPALCSEIFTRFASGTISSATTVPEPSTWAMMLVGFAGLAFAGWRARGGFRRAA
jgi:hypothetical protein